MDLLSPYGFDKVRTTKAEKRMSGDVDEQLNKLIIYNARNSDLTYIRSLSEFDAFEELGYLGLKNTSFSFHTNFGDDIVPYNLNPIYDIKGAFARKVINMLRVTNSKLITYGADTSFNTLTKMHFSSLMSYIMQDKGFLLNVNQLLKYNGHSHPERVITDDFDRDFLYIQIKLLELSLTDGFDRIEIYNSKGDKVSQLSIEEIYNDFGIGKTSIWLGDLNYAETAIAKHNHSVEDFPIPVRSFSSLLDNEECSIINCKAVKYSFSKISTDPLK